MRAAIKTVRHGSLRLDLREYADGRFGFDFAPPGGERCKVRLRSMDAAEERALEILGAARGGRVERLAIDEDEYAEFLRWKAERGTGAAIPALVSSFLESKDGKGRSIQHMRRLRCDLTTFAEAFPVRLDGVSRAQAEAWLNKRNVSPRRWNNLRESIVALARFARREGALGAALCGPEMLERRAVKITVETYAPSELRNLLKATPEEWLPLIVLGAFCGLRPQEICPDTRPGSLKPPLLWENFIWARGKLDVPAACAKDRRRRFVPLCDAALAFLKPLKKARGPVVPRLDMHRLTGAWAKAAGVRWRKDGLRHSYASYRLALIHDMGQLALEMGNSPAMIFRHYLDLKHDDEAAEWFSIRPEKVPKVSFGAARKPTK